MDSNILLNNHSNVSLASVLKMLQVTAMKPFAQASPMPAEFDKQLKILKSRIILLKRAQIAMGLSFLFNMLSVFALFFNAILPAKFFFGLCLLSIIVALIIYLYEITLSTKALKYHLLDLDNMNKKK